MSKVRIFALGGLSEDGKNMYVVENNDDIFVMECGLKYPEGEQLGIEMIIPDFTYLLENKERIKAVFISHGHDDVMSALSHLIKEIPDIPVYAAPLTALMIERKAKLLDIHKINMHRVRRNSILKVGDTEVRLFGTTQSIPDGFGVAIKTDKGFVVYSSEFIVDYDTVNEAFKFDITNITSLGTAGVLALMCESVGATREGQSAPHHRISAQLEPYFEEAKGRMFITVFNQNIYRVIEIIELANKYNRKIMIFSDELKKMMTEMAELGYYRIPAGLEMSRDSFNNDRDDVLVIVGGNGSTIFNKVHRIATKEDEQIEFRSTDTVIIASPAVPGTERSEASMEDDLYREAGKVVSLDSKRSFSMHASIEDLKMMLNLMKPRYYIPIKGTYSQLIANANIALDMGYAAERIVVLDNGEVATFDNGKLVKKFESVQVGDVMVDGNESLDSTGLVLKDRELLSTDGVMIIGVVINHVTKEIIGGPDVQSRGVIYLKDADYIVKQTGILMEKTITEAVKEKRYNNMDCRAEAREKISRYILHETGKRPMILPAIVEINTAE